MPTNPSSLVLSDTGGVPKHGFALVIALSLMALVLLLTISISSFVAVEQQSSRISKGQTLAQQNALFGLQMAIGELQLRLGPDRRATANADILNADNNPYTLVWHSDSDKGWDSDALNWTDSGGIDDFAFPLLSVAPGKLTSLIGASGRFDEAQLDNAVELMKITKPGDGSLTGLKGERRPLRGANGSISGNYAWVAQDESLKANLKTEYGSYEVVDDSGDIVDANHPMALAETSRRLSVFPYANPAAVAINGETPFASLDLQDNSQVAAIQGATDLNDLIGGGLLQPSLTTGTTTERLAPYRNHFTLNSKGVLADTKNGGLRRDLSRGLDDQYFEKLHNLPVFGANREGNIIADGVNDPVGDQWKFFRDFYQFYKPIDDGLVSDLGNQNIFYGISDVTDTNPKVRMRITNVNVAKTSDFSQRESEGTTPYSIPLTPTTVAKRNRNRLLDAQDWYALTPQLRPVVLRNACNIGVGSKKVTEVANSTNPNNADNIGKYVLQFEIYPSFTIWNPFNVAINFDPETNSPNPMANGEEVRIFQDGNIDLVFETRNGDRHKFDIGSIAPKVTLVSYRTLSDAGLPTTMPPGAIWVCGLTQDYYARIEEGNNPQYYNDEGLSDKTRDPTLLPAAVGSRVSASNKITFIDDVKDTDSDESDARKVAYFEGADILILKQLKGGDSSEYGSFRWNGQIKSRKPGNPNSTTTYSCFSLGDNSDVPLVSTEILIQEVESLTEEAYLFNAIDFRANTIGDQGEDNPAFPAFSQVNFLGAYPQVVAKDDSIGDVKALYLREQPKDWVGGSVDPLPQRNRDGYGFYGRSFDQGGGGTTRIVLYDLPRHPIVSIDDFRHLMLGWNEDAQPRPVGASWPLATLSDLSDPYIRSVWPEGHQKGKADYEKGAGCDTSYYYNDTLFDSFFFSGIPPEDRNKNSGLRKQTFPYDTHFTQDYIDADRPLANTRLSYHDNPSIEDLRGFTDNYQPDDGFEKAAAYLLIDAPFNINSTSPQAWQAILSGFRGHEITGVNSDYTSKMNYTGNGSPFVDHFIPSDDQNSLYTGHRRLSDSDIEVLSQAISTEIRSRGISRTLGAFINRSLDGSTEQQKMGRLDAAIQKAGLNSAQIHGITPDGDRRSRPDIQDSARMFEQSMVKETSAGLPGYLKQQDILRPLAPIMTSRGDTFRIRAYGESINPITGERNGEAWCEAIVQRVPEYIDDSTDAWDLPAANSDNEKFGRRLKMIHFRWLNKDEV